MEIDYKEVVNKVSTNNKKLKQKEYLQKGAYPVIDQGQELIGGYTDDETRLLDCALPAIVFGDHTKIVKLINFKFAPGADGTKVLEPKKFVLPKYLSYLTQILVFKIKDKGYARHYQHIEKQSFPIAPLPEQRAIVSKIEQVFSELDNGIANLKAAQDKLEIYRQAVLKKAFEGELTKEWRIKQKKEIKLEFIGFGDLCKFTQGIQVPIPNQSEVQKKGQVRFLRIIDFTQGNEPPRFIDNPGERYLVNSSDIALVRYGTVGFVCTGKEGAIANNLFKVAPDERLINPYLIHFLNSHLFKSHLKPKGATMQALSFGLIKPIPIPVFEIDEQKQIVQEIESRLSVCDNILANIEEGLEKSEALRQSILKQAFEGKLLSEEELEACRQEPDWEPAEKLLERVKNRKLAEA